MEIWVYFKKVGISIASCVCVCVSVICHPLILVPFLKTLNLRTFVQNSWLESKE